MRRKPRKLPDYFTEEEAADLVAAAPDYKTRMSMKIMVRTGLRVSECVSLCPADLRLKQDPPIISVRPDITGNKAKVGREVPIPADLVESLADLASFCGKDRYQPMLDYSRQMVGRNMKVAAEGAGLDPGRAHPHALRHTYGRTCILKGVPVTVLQKWMGHKSLADTQRYVELAGGHHSWVEKL